MSSEKSCLITSKKLLNGLPTQTGRKEKRDKTDEYEVNDRKRRQWRDEWGGGVIQGEESNISFKYGGRVETHANDPVFP